MPEIESPQENLVEEIARKLISDFKRNSMFAEFLEDKNVLQGIHNIMTIHSGSYQEIKPALKENFRNMSKDKIGAYLTELYIEKYYPRKLVTDIQTAWAEKELARMKSEELVFHSPTGAFESFDCYLIGLRQSKGYHPNKILKPDSDECRQLLQERAWRDFYYNLPNTTSNQPAGKIDELLKKFGFQLEHQPKEYIAEFEEEKEIRQEFNRLINDQLALEILPSGTVEKMVEKNIYFCKYINNAGFLISHTKNDQNEYEKIKNENELIKRVVNAFEKIQPELKNDQQQYSQHLLFCMLAINSASKYFSQQEKPDKYPNTINQTAEKAVAWCKENGLISIKPSDLGSPTGTKEELHPDLVTKICTPLKYQDQMRHLLTSNMMGYYWHYLTDVSLAVFPGQTIDMMFDYLYNNAAESETKTFFLKYLIETLASSYGYSHITRSDSDEVFFSEQNKRSKDYNHKINFAKQSGQAYTKLEQIKTQLAEIKLNLPENILQQASHNYLYNLFQGCSGNMNIHYDIPDILSFFKTKNQIPEKNIADPEMLKKMHFKNYLRINHQEVVNLVDRIETKINWLKKKLPKTKTQAFRLRLKKDDNLEKNISEIHKLEKDLRQIIEDKTKSPEETETKPYFEDFIKLLEKEGIIIESVEKERKGIKLDVFDTQRIQDTLRKAQDTVTKIEKLIELQKRTNQSSRNFLDNFPKSIRQDIEQGLLQQEPLADILKDLEAKNQKMLEVFNQTIQDAKINPDYESFKLALSHQDMATKGIDQIPVGSIEDRNLGYLERALKVMDTNQLQQDPSVQNIIIDIICNLRHQEKYWDIETALKFYNSKNILNLDYIKKHRRIKSISSERLNNIFDGLSS